MIGYSVVNTKGQVTIPASVRRKAKVKPRDKVMVIGGDEGLLIKPVANILSLRGSVKATRPMDIDKMEKAFQNYLGTRKQDPKR